MEDKEDWGEVKRPTPPGETAPEMKKELVGRKRPGRVIYGSREFEILSTIMGRDAHTRAERQAFMWAGMPLDNLSADGRWRLTAAARIREALERPDPAMLALADEDDELLLAIDTFVLEHQRLFRLANSGSSEGDPERERLAVVALDAAGGAAV